MSKIKYDNIIDTGRRDWESKEPKLLRDFCSSLVGEAVSDVDFLPWDMTNFLLPVPTWEVPAKGIK